MISLFIFHQITADMMENKRRRRGGERKYISAMFAGEFLVLVSYFRFRLSMWANARPPLSQGKISLL